MPDFRETVISYLRAECRYVSLEHLRNLFPEIDISGNLERIRQDSQIEFCILNAPQLRAVSSYSPDAAAYFPRHLLPRILPIDLHGLPLSAADQAIASILATQSRLSVDARSEFIERSESEAHVQIECVRFNFRDCFMSNDANSRSKRMKSLMQDLFKLLSRRREGFTIADIFIFLGLDLREDPEFLAELRKYAHYDGRDQTFSVSVLEILIRRDSKSIHWDKLKEEVGYSLGSEDFTALTRHPGVVQVKNEPGVLSYARATRFDKPHIDVKLRRIFSF
jgi:hypothetical protein